MTLTLEDRALLLALTETGGFKTGQVSKRAEFSYGGTTQVRSGAVRSWLVNLEKVGLVARLDDQKPTCWIRTPAGTEALQQTPGA